MTSWQTACNYYHW